MTTFRQTSIKCGVCGHQSAQLELTSTSTFGSPDLDTRPPALARSTLGVRIQTCSQCGYCAPNLAQVAPRACELVNDEAYRTILADENYPELARRYAAWGFIEAESGELAEAGWASLCAAWVCDDARCVEAAKRCRVQAVARFLAARQRGQSFMEGADGEEALLADALRRAERYSEARAHALAGLATRPPALVFQVLSFELSLIEVRDAGCYTVEQALKASSA